MKTASSALPSCARCGQATVRARDLLFCPADRSFVAVAPGAAPLAWAYSDNGLATCLSQTADGSAIAVGTVHAVEILDGWGRLQASVEFDEIANDIAFSPAGELLCLASSKRVVALNAQGNRLWERKVAGFMDQQRVAVSPAGPHLIASASRHLYFLTHEGKVIAKRKAAASIEQVVFSADGLTIGVGGNDGRLYCFTPEGRRLWRKRVGGWVRSVAVSGDGQTIAAGNVSGRMVVYDRSGKLVLRKDGSGAFVKVRLARQGNQILVAWAHKKLDAVDRSGRPDWSWTPSESIRDFTLAPDGSWIAVADGDRLVSLDKEGKVAWTYELDDTAMRLSVSADGARAMVTTATASVHAVDRNGRLLWWRRTEGAPWKSMLPRAGSPVPDDWSDEYLFRFARGRGIGGSRSHLSTANAVAVSADGNLVAVRPANGNVMVFDREGRTIRRLFTKNLFPSGRMGALALAADGSLLAAAAEARFLEVYDLAGTANVRAAVRESLREPAWKHDLKAKVNALAVSDDGSTIFAATESGEVLSYDRKGGTLGQHKARGALFDVQCAGSGHSLAAAGEGESATILSRELSTLGAVPLGGPSVKAAVSADGSLIAFASKNNRVTACDSTGTVLWSQATGRLPHDLFVTGDGSLVVAAALDGKLHAWDRQGTGQWTIHRGAPLWCVSGSSDGALIVAGSHDKSIVALDRSGNIRWVSTLGSDVIGVAVARNGALALASSWDDRIVAFGKEIALGGANAKLARLEGLLQAGRLDEANSMRSEMGLSGVDGRDG